MLYQKIFADFQNADSHGHLRLNCIGTVRDLARHQVRLEEGLQLNLYSEDLEAIGRVHYSMEEGLWVAVIDWDQTQSETLAFQLEGNALCRHDEEPVREAQADAQLAGGD